MIFVLKNKERQSSECLRYLTWHGHAPDIVAPSYDVIMSVKRKVIMVG